MVSQGRRTNLVTEMSITAKQSDRERLLSALELSDAGIALMRQNLRRRWPDASTVEIEARLQVWLQERPGSEFGDGPSQLVLRRSE